MPEVVLHDAADFGDRMSLFNVRTLTIVARDDEILGAPVFSEDIPRREGRSHQRSATSLILPRQVRIPGCPVR